MRTSWFHALLLLSSSSSAQYLPSELSSLQVKGPLIVQFNGTSVSQPGQRIPTNDTNTIPQVAIPQNASATSNTSATYVFLMVDPSYNTTDPTDVVLHTLETNLTLPSTSSSPSSVVQLSTKPASSPVAPYIGPQPPANATIWNHNYTVLLFTQPSDFSVPEKYAPWLPLNLSNVYSRTGFPLLGFIEDAKLGEPVAGSYFRLEVGGSNGTSTTEGGGSSTTGEPGASSSVATSGAERVGDVSKLVIGSICAAMVGLVMYR